MDTLSPNEKALAEFTNVDDIYEVHFVSSLINWGYCRNLILWIVENCHIDVATLALFFARAEPDPIMGHETVEDYMKNSRYADEFTVRLVEALIHRLEGGRGVERKIAMDSNDRWTFIPQETWDRWLAKKNGKVLFEIPLELMSPRSGIKFDYEMVTRERQEQFKFLLEPLGTLIQV